MFELGVPVNVVSKLLGHAKTSITSDIYINVIPQLKTDAVKALDSLHHSNLIHNPLKIILSDFRPILRPVIVKITSIETIQKGKQKPLKH